jgi:hypothetical protein
MLRAVTVQVEVRATAACCLMRLLKNVYIQSVLSREQWQALAWTLCDEVRATSNTQLISVCTCIVITDWQA